MMEDLVGDRLAFGVGGGVEFCVYFQTLCRGGVSDQVDDNGEAFEGLAAPVPGDVTEHAMLDPVPFACTGRQVAHLHGEAGFVRETL